jgi:hypothetical protein
MLKRIQAPYYRLQISFVFTLALLFSAGPALAQNQCTQKLSSLPAAAELYGFRLGMTKEEVKVLVPQTAFGRTDDFGVAKTTINPNFDQRIDKEKFAGVRSISLDFLDERLTSLWIGFDETYKVRTVEEFVKQISQSLRLSGTWTSWRAKGQQLRCDDFQVIVSTLAGGPSVRIVDAGAEDVVAARRVAKEEEKAAAVATDDPDAAGTEPEELIGDKNSKTFYIPGCKPTTEIAEKDKVVFKNIEEAQRSGFKLAKACQ